MTRLMTLLAGAVVFSILPQTTRAADATGAGSDRELEEPWIDVRKYAASGTGTQEDPWVDALRNAYAAHGNFQRYNMPGGHYEDASTCDLEAHRITIQGDGPQITWWYYHNTDASPCLRLSSNGRMMPYNTIRGICFEGNNKATGAAIEFVAQQYLLIEDVDIRHFNAGKENGTSKGIVSKGWTNNRFRNVTVGYSTICFSIEDNPYSQIDADLYHFDSMSFSPNDYEYGVGLNVKDAQVWNLSMGGSTEISNCRYGVRWVSNNKQRTRQVSFSNMRFEGGKMDYFVYMDLPGKALDSLRFSNVLCPDVNICGFRLSNVSNVIFDGCYMMIYRENSVAIEADARVKPVLLLGTTINETAPVNIAAPLVFEARTTGGGGFHYLSYYDSDDTPFRFHTNVLQKMQTVPYQPSIVFDPNTGNSFLIDVTDANDFTIVNPKRKDPGQELTLIIKNSSGGEMGNIVLDSHFLLQEDAPLEKPENGKYLTISFICVDGIHWAQK